eukprot:745474_1
MTTLHVILLICGKICVCQWYKDSSTFQWNRSCMAIGSYNDFIYILGGTDMMNSLTVYNPRNHGFVESYLTTDVFGYSSYYTQLHNVKHQISLEISLQISFPLSM